MRAIAQNNTRLLLQCLVLAAISTLASAALGPRGLRIRGLDRDATAAPKALPQLSSVFESTQETCDLEASGPICFSGRGSALLPAASVPGLAGRWTFDDDGIALDSSGAGHHAVSKVRHGPSPAGSGYSAMFTAGSFLKIPAPGLLQHFGADFTYSFWVYLPDEGSMQGQAQKRGKAASEDGDWCVLLRKGQDAMHKSAPAIFVQEGTGRIRASVSTSGRDAFNAVEQLDSNARVRSNRWFHLAVVYRSERAELMLYANGMLDSATTLHGAVARDDSPLFIGSDPTLTSQCKRTVYIDDVSVFGRAVHPHELQAEAAPALGGMDPSFVHLGCTSCSIYEAVRTCPPSRHICTSLELHTGGYQLAHSIGWLSSGRHVWTHAAVSKEKDTEKKMGLADRSNFPVPNPKNLQLGLALCCEGPA